MTPPRILISVILLALAACPSAKAVEVFSTLGAGDSYDSFGGALIAGPSTAEPQAVMQQFTVAADYYLDSAELALQAGAGVPSLRVQIYEDAAGSPGAVIGSTQVGAAGSGLVTASFNTATDLVAGNSYWLGLLADGSGEATWFDSLNVTRELQAVSFDDGSTWETYYTEFAPGELFPGTAFRINGTPIAPADVSLIEPGDAWRYFRGLEEPSVGTAWAGTTFDDTAWDFDLGGFGYDNGTNATEQAGLLSHVATELTDMQETAENASPYTTLYLRREFTVASPQELSELILRLDYDDAFIAYVNGVEVARSEFGTPGIAEEFDSIAGGAVHESTNGDPAKSLDRYTIDLVNDYPGLVTAGSGNVLAIHGINSALDDDDFVLSQISLGGNYFSVVLPGDYNNDGIVNLTDYSVWRDNLGAPAGTLANDIHGVTVGTPQYLTWKVQFGETSGAATSPVVARTAVPEPASGRFIGLIALLGLVSSRAFEAHRAP